MNSGSVKSFGFNLNGVMPGDAPLVSSVRPLAPDRGAPRFFVPVSGYARRGDTARAMLDNIPLLRSLLFVPAGDARKTERALASAADAVILDLEDALAGDQKAGARQAAGEVVARAGGAMKVVVRVNAIETELTRDDVQAVVRQGLTAVVLPKVRAPQDLRDLDVLLREAETARGVRPGAVAVIPLIESARALLRCEEIARATDRAIALALGGEDLSLELGVERTADGAALAHARGVIATVAAAYGMQAIDAPWIDFGDSSGLERDAQVARAVGFGGKLAIHPDQLPVINNMFAPGEREIAEAQRIVAAFSEGAGGAVSAHGRMIDAPVVERARRTLALAERVRSQGR